MVLSSLAEHAELLAYLEERHPQLAPLLPEDTEGSDLFDQVRNQKDLATFFDDAPAGAEKRIQRALARFENDISARIAEEAENRSTSRGRARRSSASRSSRARRARRSRTRSRSCRPA